MTARRPLTDLGTHEVTNQPPPLVGTNAFDDDPALRAALVREGGAWGEDDVRRFGARVASAEVIRWGEDANRNPPELRAFDRYGQRIDEVDYHPAYHDMMALAATHRVPSVAWTAEGPGGHVVHAALLYLLTQAEAGVCCPVAMAYAAVPALRRDADVAAEWVPRITAAEYDGRSLPAGEKRAATIGMAMTEKQGGSDVRANTTRARPANGSGGGAYLLTGHKWFCSAPMSDAFLTLAYMDSGLSCFLVPRWRPDGSRNAFRIQRLKDKLGNRSNASAEIEYDDTWGRLVGEEGRGISVIMDMVHHTRLETAVAPAGMMRQAVVQAVHHAAHRSAFQKTLIDQPLMQAVLADMALESEAATHLVMRIAGAYDRASSDEGERMFSRLAVAVTKYWVNKRLPNLVYEAMECLGGAGYVEESPMPRLYREAPLNSIWEGSGNVICLDVLRALEREPQSAEVYFAELEPAQGADPRLDAAIDGVRQSLAATAGMETRARSITENMALALQGALLVRHAPGAIAEGFLATRLAGDWGRAYGTLPPGLDTESIIGRFRSAVP